VDKAGKGEMRTLEKPVSLVLVVVICGGLAYAHNRESLRETNLNPVFQQINREAFGGELSGVTIEWSHLDQERGESRKLGEDEFLIRVDPNDVTTARELKGVLAHEACRIQVDWKEPEEHGPLFYECMKRFE
jgi:hypothetical protein